MAAEALAAFEGVHKSYGPIRALEGLDLEVHAGEVLGLLGPNGAGKTTAVRILVGLLEPTGGRVHIGGHDLATEPLEAKRRIGYVPDGAPLYASLSALAHLQLVGRLHGMEEEPLQAEALRLLAALGLEERARTPVGGFSRGMRQRAALACAILPRPRILVLDEPLTGLDAPSATMFKEVLRAWADQGGAVLYTSHLLDVVEKVCDRMAILEKGRLIALGGMDELRERAGSDGSLEEVFGRLTAAADPAEEARRVLGLA